MEEDVAEPIKTSVTSPLSDGSVSAWTVKRILYGAQLFTVLLLDDVSPKYFI